MPGLTLHAPEITFLWSHFYDVFVVLWGEGDENQLGRPRKGEKITKGIYLIEKKEKKRQRESWNGRFCGFVDTQATSRPNETIKAYVGRRRARRGDLVN